MILIRARVSIEKMGTDRVIHRFFWGVFAGGPEPVMRRGGAVGTFHVEP